MDLEQQKYPVGKFEKPDSISTDTLENSIRDIATFPSRLKQTLENFREKDLDLQYRHEGWTVRQVVNHCADSHMNALMRVKLSMTEDQPVIKPFLEAEWAELDDSRNFPIEAALQILEGVHKRWAYLLTTLTTDQWQRTFIHPQNNSEISLAESTFLYAWHCRHHLGHVEIVKRQLRS